MEKWRFDTDYLRGFRGWTRGLRDNENAELRAKSPSVSIILSIVIIEIVINNMIVFIIRYVRVVVMLWSEFVQLNGKRQNCFFRKPFSIRTEHIRYRCDEQFDYHRYRVDYLEVAIFRLTQWLLSFVRFSRTRSSWWILASSWNVPIRNRINALAARWRIAIGCQCSGRGLNVFRRHGELRWRRRYRLCLFARTFRRYTPSVSVVA